MAQMPVMQWVNSSGNPVLVGKDMTPNQDLVAHVSQVAKGLALGDVNTLTLREVSPGTNLPSSIGARFRERPAYRCCGGEISPQSNYSG